MNLQRTVTLVLLAILILDVVAENGEKWKGKRKKKKNRKKWKSKAKMELIELSAKSSTKEPPPVAVPGLERSSFSSNNNQDNSQ